MLALRLACELNMACPDFSMLESISQRVFKTKPQLNYQGAQFKGFLRVKSMPPLCASDKRLLRGTFVAAQSSIIFRSVYFG
jgi:hypothetical protein